MPWSDVAERAPFDRQGVVDTYDSGGIEVRAQQLPAALGTPELIAELSSSLEVVRRSVSDSYWIWHERLERDGRLHRGVAAGTSGIRFDGNTETRRREARSRERAFCFP
jgi:hypothetical protein